MANADKFMVQGTIYNVVSPSVFGEFIETIGGACTNPDGYAVDDVFLAMNNNVQALYKATEAINQGANIVENTNCEQTSLKDVKHGGSGASSADQVSYDNTTSHLTGDDVQEAIDEVAAQNQTLTNLINKKSTYQYPSNITSGTLANAIATVYAAVPFTSGVAIALVSNDVTGRPVGTGWGVIILYVCAGTQNCHVVYQDTWSSKAVDGMFNASNSTVEWNPYLADSVSNPNLLDNPWFTVNQRGYTTDSSSGKYPADRWQFVYNPKGCTISRSGNQLVIDNTQSGAGNAYFFQLFEDTSMVGKMLTASVMLSDGTIISGSAIMPALEQATQDAIVDNIHKFRVYLQHLTNGSRGVPAFAFEFHANCSLTIKAVKLELGTVSTLAHDTAPNYQQELAKCQRYFQRVAPSNSGAPYGYGFSYSATSHRITMPFVRNMRTHPSITGDITKWQVRTADGQHYGAPTAVELSNYESANGLQLNITSADFGSTTSMMVLLTCGYATGYLDFSADL